MSEQARTENPFFVWIANIMFFGGMAALLVAAFWGLSVWRDSYWHNLKLDCISRGGYIIETGGNASFDCVNPKVLRP